MYIGTVKRLCACMRELTGREYSERSAELLLKLLRLRKRLIKVEERFNPYHDPKSGRFSSGNGDLTPGANSGIIKKKNSELENGLPIKGKPNSTVDKTDDSGKVLQRRKYGADGLAAVDFDTSDHKRPDVHPTGAHKHEFDHSKKNPRGKALPLSEQELSENSDIIKRGENYHDGK